MVQPTASEPLPRRFGRYMLFDHVGRGGMADIFLARAATEIGGARLAVVKRILPELAADERFARMLVDEAKLAARLSHANVVQVFDLGRTDENDLFIAMEYVEGWDLHQLLRRLSQTKTPLPAELVFFIARQVLVALDVAHRAKDDDGRPLGLVHRDVSPANVLVSLEGEVKLCDFGIARALALVDEHGGADEGDAARSRSHIAGKAAYMSPEHARGERVDARADVFAAGVLLWELCAGRRMYRGSDEEVFALAKAGRAPELPPRGLPMENELRALIGRALAPRPEDRFASAAEMLRALDAWLDATGLHATPMRLRDYLETHFGADEVLAVRRRRERAAQALALGPPVVMAPIRTTTAPVLLVTRLPSSAGATAAPAQPRTSPWIWVAVGMVALAILGAAAWIALRTGNFVH